MYVRLPVLESYIRLCPVADVRLDLQRLQCRGCLACESHKYLYDSGTKLPPVARELAPAAACEPTLLYLMPRAPNVGAGLLAKAASRRITFEKRESNQSALAPPLGTSPRPGVPENNNAPSRRGVVCSGAYYFLAAGAAGASAASALAGSLMASSSRSNTSTELAGIAGLGLWAP